MGVPWPSAEKPEVCPKIDHKGYVSAVFQRHSQDIKPDYRHNARPVSGTCRDRRNSLEDGLSTAQDLYLHYLGTLTMSAASTILVVEDDAIVRMLIVDVLEELEFKVLEAADAEAALAFLEDSAHVIDLMMTDWGLPGMNGKELAVKTRTLRPALPILLASGYAENIELPAGVQMIAKPFSIEQLRDKVKGMLVGG
jgi:CheY-like chemotaxis protein